MRVKATAKLSSPRRGKVSCLNFWSFGRGSPVFYLRLFAHICDSVTLAITRGLTHLSRPPGL